VRRGNCPAGHDLSLGSDSDNTAPISWLRHSVQPPRRRRTNSPRWPLDPSRHPTKMFPILAIARKDETVRTMGTADAANRSEGAFDDRAQSLGPRPPAQDLFDANHACGRGDNVEKRRFRSPAYRSAPAGGHSITPQRSYDYSRARDTMVKEVPRTTMFASGLRARLPLRIERVE
jgi:hypothetical protein